MGWELITPDSLAELDSSQNTKLGGISTQANKTTFPTNTTEGQFSFDIDGTTSTNDVFSSGERTKLNRLRLGQAPDDAAVSIKNNAITISKNGTAIRLNNAGGFGDITFSNSDVGLGNVPNFSAETMRAGTTSSHVGLGNVPNYSAATMMAQNLTGTIGGVANATVRSGAAAGATANQDSTASIRAGTTKANVGLGNVPNYTAETMRAGTTKSHVGLGNVPNYTAATMMGQNHTGTLNGVAASTVTSGASLGATANQDSTATIRGGVTTATITSGGNSHLWTIESSTEYAPSSSTITTTIEWRSGTGGLLTTATITSTLQTSDNTIDVSRSGSGVTFGGSQSNIGASGSTTTATYNSIKASVYHAVIDVSGWTFK